MTTYSLSTVRTNVTPVPLKTDCAVTTNSTTMSIECSNIAYTATTTMTNMVVTPEILFSYVEYPEKYWFSNYKFPYNAEGYEWGSTFDNLNNLYTIANTYFYSDSNGIRAYITKYNSLGEKQWQKEHNTTGTPVDAIATDLQGNVYIVGSDYNATFDSITLFKYSSAGVLQWQRSIFSETENLYGYGITLDSTGNIYIAGSIYASDSLFGVAGLTEVGSVYKLDNSGTILWQYKYTIPNFNTWCRDITIDSNNNLYLNLTQLDDNSRKAVLLKLNNSGEIIWQRALVSEENYFYSERNIVVDSENNVYIFGMTGQIDTLTVFKYNSSGTLIWQSGLERKILVPSSNSTSFYPGGLAIDNENNVYITAQLTGVLEDEFDYENFLIVKFNSTGTALWSNMFAKKPIVSNPETDQFAQEYPYSISCDTLNNVYVSGEAYIFDNNNGGLYYATNAKLSGSGSLLGRHSFHEYKSINLSNNTYFTTVSTNFTTNPSITVIKDSISYTQGNPNITISDVNIVPDFYSNLIIGDILY